MSTATLAESRPRRKSWRPTIVLAILLLLIGVPSHSTAKCRRPPGLAGLPASRATPACAAAGSSGALAGMFSRVEAAKLRSSQGQAPRAALAPAAAFAPVLALVPSSNGEDLFISAGGVGQLGGTAFVNIDTGPSGNKGSYTMTYSDTIQSYVTTVSGVDPQSGATGPLNITTTLGLATPIVRFNRARVPPGSTDPILSDDLVLQLAPVSPDTFTELTYIAVAPSFAPPAPAPAGHRLIGRAYSVRASGGLTETLRPMLLDLRYATPLNGADPHTLAIFAWDEARKRWDNLGGQLDAAHSSVAVATRRFTTYALMATPAWYDQFDDFGFSGLAERTNISLAPLGAGRGLALANAPGSGLAVSLPISPTAEFAGWGRLTFGGAADPPTTTLTVDVLSVTGTLILADVASGADLSAIDPLRYPALKLRANFASSSAATPVLDWWRLTWLAEPPERRWYVYAPLIVR